MRSVARLQPTPSLARRLTRSHARARRRSPYLQGVAVATLLPVVLLLARVRVRGREHLPGSGGFVLAPNHPSVLDGVFAALAVLPRRISFMGMAELWRRPLPAWVMSRIGAFPVVRGTWDADAFTTAATVLRRGRVLVMFPEGGVSPPGGYKPARAGIGHLAHTTGAVVVPVHLDGPRRLYRPWTWPRVTVTVGPPITVEEDPDPSRERSLETARRILTAVAALDPGVAEHRAG
ncbi:1-acyl-sn-glycerol-3-phosphate acyltransferase [Paraconexibacter algicola]|uniref:1-acyl-sn-glycerol-3-phosphate acyltransferase n=1 Tax=Paraconexibacter algicola TaxID=2133960 RepID=A0A2T4UGA2_9ACTN|nr:1-acyl-sn-glycerol-3-phosphate acyltransferase [Paraconexibacter algicola]